MEPEFTPLNIGWEEYKIRESLGTDLDILTLFEKWNRGYFQEELVGYDWGVFLATTGVCVLKGQYSEPPEVKEVMDIGDSTGQIPYMAQNQSTPDGLSIVDKVAIRN